jgi:hypothetical protein
MNANLVNSIKIMGIFWAKFQVGFAERGFVPRGNANAEVAKIALVEYASQIGWSKWNKINIIIHFLQFN